jgi:hypothetical protein
MADVKTKDWISIACWAWIGMFVVLKVVFLAQGQSLASWLDVTNPSVFGLMFTACVITLIVRSRRRNKSTT